MTRFAWGRLKLTKGTDADKEVKEKDRTAAKWTQITEYPFDSSVKRMAVTYTNNQAHESYAMMKGAVERVLESCTSAQTAEGKIDFDEEFEKRVLENMEALAGQGLRVLALAHRKLTDAEKDLDEELERADVESNMTFLGLVGLYDPPRPRPPAPFASARRQASRSECSPATTRHCQGYRSRRRNRPPQHDQVLQGRARQHGYDRLAIRQALRGRNRRPPPAAPRHRPMRASD